MESRQSQPYVAKKYTNNKQPVRIISAPVNKNRLWKCCRQIGRCRTPRSDGLTASLPRRTDNLVRGTGDDDQHCSPASPESVDRRVMSTSIIGLVCARKHRCGFGHMTVALLVAYVTRAHPLRLLWVITLPRACRVAFTLLSLLRVLRDCPSHPSHPSR